MKGDDYTKPAENLPTSSLRKVISDLMEGNNIEGAVLIRGKDTIIACDISKEKNYSADILKILALIEDWGGSAIYNNPNNMFVHCIVDYNGCKVLAKKLNYNLTLLVMLQKKGYVGPAMLDLENSAREIERILDKRGLYKNEFILKNPLANKYVNKS